MASPWMMLPADQCTHAWWGVVYEGRSFVVPKKKRKKFCGVWAGSKIGTGSGTSPAHLIFQERTDQQQRRRTGQSQPAASDSSSGSPPGDTTTNQASEARERNMALRRSLGSLALRSAAAYLRRHCPPPPPPLALAAPAPTPIRRPLAPQCRHFASPPGTQVGTRTLPPSVGKVSCCCCCCGPFISPSFIPCLVT